MNKKTTKTETKKNPESKELIKTVTETKPKVSKELKTVSKSITTINHRSKEAQEIRETKFNLIINDIQNKGIGLNKAAKKHGLNPNTFFNMVEKDSLLLKQYTRALELKADVIAERIIRNSHNRANDFYTDSEGNVKPNPVAVQRDRLMLDADKWLLSKIAPKKYGDKLTLDGEVKTGNPLTIENINMILNELKDE
jgi:predicted HTH domain antitoxin